MSKLQLTADSQSHPGLATVRRVAVNVASLLTSDVLNRAATFVVYALVAQHCGSRPFGQLSLGLMLLYTFQVFASAGLPTLLTREVAKQPETAGRYLLNGSAIVLGTFVLSMGALVLLVMASGYPRDTSEIVLLLGLSVLPWSLTTLCEAVLKARERMHLIVLVALPVNAIKIGASFYLLAGGRGVRSVALVLLVSHTAALLFEWLVLRRFARLQNAHIDPSFCRLMLSRTWRFLGIDSLIAVWAGINTLLLSWFDGEAAVGLFGAAWQLLVPVTLALQAIDNSLFPLMCRHAEGDRKRMQQLTVWMLEILAIVAVPGCVLLYFAADTVISIIYGHADFSRSVVALRIMLPVLLLHAVSTTFGQVLYSARREHATLRIIMIDVAFNLVCGMALIYAFGLIGAAVTVLLTWTLNAWLHYAAARETLTDEAGQGLPWNTSLLLHVFAAGCAMAGVLAAATPLNILVASILTTGVYAALLAALVFAACRGPLGFRERFLMPLIEHDSKGVATNV